MDRRSRTALILVAMAMIARVSGVCATEIRPNTWGIYAAPTTHNIESGTDELTTQSTMSLDFGMFYARTIARGYAVRIEGRYSSREFDGYFTSEIIPAAFFLQPMREQFLEFPVVLYGAQNVSLGEASVRISAGVGAYYAVLLSQDFLGGPSSLPDAPQELDAGGYSRYGWIADGGVSLLYRPDNAVFLNFRLADDLGITGEPEPSIAREEFAFGFYAGFEWLF